MQKKLKRQSFAERCENTAVNIFRKLPKCAFEKCCKIVSLGSNAPNGNVYKSLLAIVRNFSNFAQCAFKESTILVEINSFELMDLENEADIFRSQTNKLWRRKGKF